MVTYAQFLESKTIAAKKAGLEKLPRLSRTLFPLQKDATQFALAAGRSAMFLDTGLGKTLCEIEFARHVPGRTLILAPLAVAPQTVREAKGRLGLDIHHSRDGKPGDGITVANYEKLHLFDADEFTGIVLDESSILKSFAGKTKMELCAKFARTPFRLAATATPAPNDYMELGNHSEFLGVMPNTEMLMRWFIHDSADTGVWKMKGHAEKAFWQWVSSWAVCASKPSDLGHDDGAYALPPLNTHIHKVSTDQTKDAEEGFLFRCPGTSATTMHAEKRLTSDDRVKRVAELCAAEPDESWLVWCESNEESAALTKAIKGAVEVKGSGMSTDEKESRLDAFARGEARVLVTKPSIAGYGLNLQVCARVVFSSLSYSYESFYQAIRRSWRFGQTRAVDVHVIIAETEINIWRTIQHKLENHDKMKRAMRHAVFKKGAVHHVKNSYNPKHKDTLPKWLKTIPTR